jgi:hypothetical protein
MNDEWGRRKGACVGVGWGTKSRGLINAPVLVNYSRIMSDIAHSTFVREVADEFTRHYQGPTVVDDSGGEIWFECRNPTPSRLRSRLAFGITDASITVAFDGLTYPIPVRAPVGNSVRARREAFALFDDLIHDRKVALSFWQGDECVSVEFVPREDIQFRAGSWPGHAVRVRSWTERHDHESQG